MSFSQQLVQHMTEFPAQDWVSLKLHLFSGHVPKQPATMVCERTQDSVVTNVKVLMQLSCHLKYHINFLLFIIMFCFLNWLKMVLTLGSIYMHFMPEVYTFFYQLSLQVE
jgi:hypothetical protein